MSSYSVGFDIFATDRASGVINQVAGRVDDAGSRMDKWKDRAKIAAVAAGAAITKFGIDSMHAYVDAEKQQRVLEDAYARFPAVADVPIAKMREMAQALQSKTKFDGDEINAMQGKLAAYKLTGSQIQTLTPLVLDYAAKTGKDLTTATQDVGKALMGQGRALKGIGLNFKDAGSTGANFEQLMGGLRTQVGGFAEQEGASAEGKLAILRNKFGDLQETVGSKLMPVAERLTEWLIKAVDWISQNEGKAKALGIAFGALAVALGVSKVAMLAQAGAAGLVATWHGLVAAKTAIWTGAQWLLNVALTANPIGLVVVAIGALVAGIIWVAKNTTIFQDTWRVMTNALGTAWRWLWNTIIAPIIRFILNGFANLTSGIASFLRALGNIPGFGWAKTAADKMDAAAGKARALARGITDIPDTHNTKVTANTANAQAHIASLKRALRSIPDERVSVFVDTVNRAARGVSYGVQARASGGRYEGGKPLLTGEDGPELQFPDSGGYVVDAATTARILANSGRPATAAAPGGGGDVHVTAVLTLDGREIHRSLLRFKRGEGGEGLGLG